MRRDRPGAGQLRPLIATLALVALVALVAGGCRGGSETVPVPDPDLSGVDPPVAAAVDLARAEVMRNRDSAQAWGELAIVLDAHEMFPEAIAAYRRAAELDPADSTWPYLEAIVLGIQEPASALPAFERAIEIDPESALYHHFYADSLLRLGQEVNARTHYLEALELDPACRRAMLGIAELSLREGQLDVAEAHLRQAASLRFGDREVHAKLARLYRDRGDEVRAEREALLMRAYPEQSPVADAARARVLAAGVGVRALTARGLADLSAGRLADAEAAFRAAVELRPDNARNRLNLGGVLARQGRGEEALRVFRQARDLDPQNPEMHSNLAALLLEMGLLDEASEHIVEGLKLDPENAALHFNAGVIAERANDPAAAEAAFRAAIAADPVHATAHASLARLLAGTNRPREAIVRWWDAVEFDVGNPETAVTYAMYASRYGQFDTALAGLRRALQRAPGHVSALAAAATILATSPDPRVRNGKTAESMARRLVEINGDRHVPSLNLLAAALAESGDFDEAVAVSVQALALARDAGRPEIVARIESRLALYRESRPYHQVAPAARPSP